MDVQQQAPPVATLTYRLRVNASGGSETKVTLPGDNILRLTAAGAASSWNSFDGSCFHQLAPSGILPSQAAFTVVTLVTDATSITLFENGVFKYQRTYSSTAAWSAGVAVQHLDVETEMSVDVGGIRVLPSIKPQSLLAVDLQPQLLAYYPLKTDVQAAGSGLPLTPVGGGQPAFGPGKYGAAAVFGQTGPVLALPSPTLATSPSYTVSAWVNVTAYPASGQSAGIAGTMQLSSDGRVDYRFLYNDDSGIGRSATFASTNPLSLGDWHHVAVTYSFDEARLVMYVDGAVDSVRYLGPEVARASALVPALGCIGGAQASFDTAMIPLNGSVGDVMFLSQHIHELTARMLAGLGATDEDVTLPLFPFFILIVAVAAAGVIILMLRTRSPQRTPSLAEVATRIQDHAGRPASTSARVSRADIRIDDNYPIKLDIGGEGRLRVGGLVTGFTDAINVNAVLRGDGVPAVTVAEGALAGSPIPNLVYLHGWSSYPPYPFADSFADQIVMIGSPLYANYVPEIARVIKPNGVIDLWIDDRYLPQVCQLAQLLSSSIEEPPEIPDFAGNGDPRRGQWCTRRRVVSHKRSS